VTVAQEGRGIERGYFVTAACATCIIIFITRFDLWKREKAGEWTWYGRRNPFDVMRSKISWDGIELRNEYDNKTHR